MDLSTSLHDARVSSGHTQGELAAKAGCSLHAVWEAERGNGTVELFARLCAALELRVVGIARGRTFGEQVKAVRVRRGWSQEKLAERAGVSPMAIGRLETGNARIATLQAVLNVLAPDARIAKSPGGQWQGRGNSDCRFTPISVLERVEHVIGSIDLDPCADRDAFVQAQMYFYEEDDGLKQAWHARTVFCNPPYSRTTAFLRKAFASWSKGDSKVILLLLPVQTHIAAFHECVIRHADVFLLQRAISFERPSGRRDKAPFGSMIVLYGGDEQMISRMLMNFDCVHLPRGVAIGRASDRDEAGRVAVSQQESRLASLRLPNG